MIITIVLPIFAIILCGFLAGRFALLPATGAGALNSFVYYFALPALLFFSLAEAPVSEITDLNFIAVNAFSVLSCFLLASVLFLFVFKKKFPDVALYGMASSYGNTGFLGIPFLITAFGQEAAVPAAIANFIYDLLLLSMVIISFEVSKAVANRSDGEKNAGPVAGTVLKAVLLNPINASLLAGVLVAVLPVSMPEPVYVFTDILGAAAGPTALFALGLGLVGETKTLKPEGFRLNEMITILGLKLFFQPLVAMALIFFLFPLDELGMMTTILLTAMPTGALVYVFALKYRALVKLAPVLVLISTLFSIVTLSVLLLLLERM